MSGHSKWSTIKHKKAATDAKRGQVFSRLAREMIIAARDGGGDLSANITLRAIVQKARAVNMPADNIDRAIKRGTGELAGAALEEIVYEAFAVGGVGLMIEVLTDNRNRTAADVRHVLGKYGVGMAGQGSVQRLFQRKGQIEVDRGELPEERLLELVIEAGADDLQSEEDRFVVTSAPGDYETVLTALEKAAVPVRESSLTMVPETTIPVTDKDAAGNLLRLMEELEDLDDVQAVHANFDMDDDLLAQLEG